MTPVIEVDGRERYADTYYYTKKLPQGSPQLPLTWWGKYVSHDDNRDNMGQMLKLSQNATRTFLEWHPPSCTICTRRNLSLCLDRHRAV